MITALLIDDEPDARALMRNLLDNFCPEVSILGEAGEIAEAVELVSRLSPQLIFLDIRLGNENGFELFEKIPSPTFQTIFVTAYDEYAVRAIRVSALDFLLKPIDPKDLVNAVQKVTERAQKSDEDIRYQVFRHKISQSEKPDQIVLPTQEGFQIAEVEDIIRCEADRNYTTFFLSQQRKVVIPRTLKFYEELLEQAGFFRIHQSHLVNLRWVKEYKRRKKGGVLFLKEGTELPVAESRKIRFQQMFLR